MGNYLNAEWRGDPIAVPWSDRNDLPGQWRSVRFDYEYADSNGVHTNGSEYVLNSGPLFIMGTLDLWLTDFAPNAEIQIRQYEDDLNGNRDETGYPHEFYTADHDSPDDNNDGIPDYPRTTHYRYPVFSYVNSGHRFGIELSQWTPDPASPTGFIKKAHIQAKLFTS